MRDGPVLAAVVRNEQTAFVCSEPNRIATDFVIVGVSVFRFEQFGEIWGRNPNPVDTPISSGVNLKKIVVIRIAYYNPVIGIPEMDRVRKRVGAVV